MRDESRSHEAVCWGYAVNAAEENWQSAYGVKINIAEVEQWALIYLSEGTVECQCREEQR